MNPYTFIFMGQSGSGKGEQSKKLHDLLKEKYSQDEVLYFETGPSFRQFVSGEKYSNKLSKSISDNGKLQPSFLAIHFWANMLLENLKGNEHILLDGICRMLLEAEVFTTAMEFYNRKPIIIYINISRKVAKERLSSRGRIDDKTSTQVEGRLDWFEEYTLPVVEYFKNNDRYTVLDINGEQSIEEVHQEILKKLGW